MTTPDYILLIIIGLSAIVGLMRGFVREVLSLLSWLAAFFVALYFAESLGAVLENQFGNPTLRFGVSFGLLFIATLILSSFLIFLITKLVSSTGLGGTDRVFGFVFGGLRGAVICTVGLIALRSFAQDSDWWNSSEIAPVLLSFEANLLELFGRAGGAVSQVKDAITNP